MSKSSNKFKLVSEVLNLNILQLQKGQNKSSDKVIVQEYSFSRCIRLAYTEETVKRFESATAMIIPKLSVKGIAAYSKFEMQKKLESMVLEHITSSKLTTEQDVRLMVTKLKSEMNEIRKFVFPVSGVIYENKKMMYSEIACFMSFQQLMEEEDLPTAQMSPSLSIWKDIKFMVLVISQTGANNPITRNKALEHAESAVAMLNEQSLNYNCKIINFNEIEDAPNNESDGGLFNSYLQISNTGSTVTTATDWNTNFMRLSSNVQQIKDNYKSVLTPVTDIQRRIKSALQWLGKASADPVLSRKFLQAMIAIEALLEDKENGSTIVDQISTAVCFILENDLAGRLELKTTIKRMYNLRSRIVHDGAEQVSWDEFNQLYAINNQVIHELLTRDEFKSFEDVSDLQKWLENRKFS